MTKSEILEIANRNLASLEKIYQQRRTWLYASSAVFFGIICLIFSWNLLDNLHNKSIWWVIVSLMLLVSINWWYWTIRVLKILLDQRTAEITIINELLNDIHDVKLDLSDLSNIVKKISK